MAGEGRSFRRKTSQFWELWPLPPKVESSSSVIFVDGIYLARNACILICCNETHILGMFVDMSILRLGRLYYDIFRHLQ